MVDLVAAETACEGAVTRATHEDQARAWWRFKMWCDSVRLTDDYFLDNFSRGQRIRLVGAFTIAMRGGRFPGPSYDALAEGTIRGDISHVSSTCANIHVNFQISLVIKKIFLFLLKKAN